MKTALLGAVLLLVLIGQASAGALPALNVTGIGGIGHDVASGWKKPVLFAAECVVGPHYGPVYVGGACTTQGADGLGDRPCVRFLRRPGLHTRASSAAWRSRWASAGRASVLGGPPGYFVLLGVSR